MANLVDNKKKVFITKMISISSGQPVYKTSHALSCFQIKKCNVGTLREFQAKIAECDSISAF